MFHPRGFKECYGVQGEYSRRRELIRLPWFILRSAEERGRLWSTSVGRLGVQAERSYNIVRSVFGGAAPRTTREMEQRMYCAAPGGSGLSCVVMMLGLFFGSFGRNDG